VVKNVEVQREQIMATLIEVQKNIQHIWGWVESHATVQQRKKAHMKPAQKEGEEVVLFVIQGREAFMITHQMIRLNQETM
jgi:hypothetical protein